MMRCGNKSVVSDVWPDDRMPYTKDGRKADVLLNLLAIINRTTGFVLYELLMTGSSYKIQQKMATLPTLKEKEDLLFRFIALWNEDESEEMHADFKRLTKKEKEKYIQDAIDGGIYIHQDAMWESKPLFYRCIDVLREFPEITAEPVYIKKWGREYKMLQSYLVGSMFLMRLKQTDRRGFSARSTGAVDTKGLPTRSFKSKSHMERISSSCIRFRTLNPYIVIYMINSVNCWELSMRQSAAKR